MDIEVIGEELGYPISFQNLNPKSRNQCPLYKGRLRISGISITVSSVSITHMILVCPIFPMEINNPCSESLCQDLFAQKPSPPSLLAKLVFLGPLFNFPPPYLSQPSTTICNHLQPSATISAYHVRANRQLVFWDRIPRPIPCHQAFVFSTMSGRLCLVGLLVLTCKAVNLHP